MEPEPFTPPAAPPVDLELRVRLTLKEGRQVLRYELHSPSGASGFQFKAIAEAVAIDSPERFRTELFQRLEELDGGRGKAREAQLSPAEVFGELERLGRRLYDALFPTELKGAYRRFRDSARTLQITSDEPWIPWELIKPYDDSDPQRVIDDDFLCMRFQLTRWLAGDNNPAGVITVQRLAVAEAGTAVPNRPLAGAVEERERVARLAGDDADVRVERLPQPKLAEVVETLGRGGLGLFHFVGHGVYDPRHPEESRIALTDRNLRPENLSGPLRTRLRQDRPLVFLNACQVGGQGWCLTGLAGWTRSWVVDCACGAFLGPQWSVPDDLAPLFADTFYTALEKGHTLGEAARRARWALRERAPGRSSWLAYAVYAHPNGRLRLGSRISPVPAHVSAAADVPQEVRRHVLDAGGLIAEKAQGFVGRKWVFDRIDRFLEKEDRGYFLLLGDPGIGKSALLARLVESRGWLHHFNVRMEGIRRPETFLANVCAQLIAAHKLGHAFLPPEATRDAAFLSKLFEEAAAKLRPRGERVILLVDALDEAETPSRANTLYLPTRLPEGVYVVATSRRGEYHLRTDSEIEEFELAQDDEGNLADVQEFVEGHLERPGIRRYVERNGLSRETFAAELVDKSEGNFMYLHHVLPAIDDGLYRNRDFTGLPRGLANYYEDNWRLIRKQDETAWFDYKLPVLVALTVVREPVSLELIQAFSGVERRARVREVLQEWAQFLYATEAGDDRDGQSKRYRFYHASFQDFVAAKDEVADERVDLPVAHGKIADVLWKDLYGEE